MSWRELGRRLGLGSPDEPVEFDDRAPVSSARAAAATAAADPGPDEATASAILTMLKISNERREELDRIKAAGFSAGEPRVPAGVTGLSLAELARAVRLGEAARRELMNSEAGRAGLAAMADSVGFAGGTVPAGRTRELLGMTQLGRDCMARGPAAFSGGPELSPERRREMLAHSVTGRKILAEEAPGVAAFADGTPMDEGTRRLLAASPTGRLILREALAKEGRVA